MKRAHVNLDRLGELPLVIKSRAMKRRWQRCPCVLPVQFRRSAGAFTQIQRSFHIHLRGFFSSITAHVAAAVIPASATSSKTSSVVPIGVILATRGRPPT